MNRSLCIVILLSLLLCGCGSAYTAETTAAPQTIVETAAPSVETEPARQFVEVWREGEVSQIPVEMVRGMVGNYVIAMDPEYFTFVPGEDRDLFSYDQWDADRPVYFAISKYDGDYDPVRFTSEVQSRYGRAYSSCEQSDTVIGQYPAVCVALDSHEDAPFYARHLYLLDCGEMCYVIEAEFTLEMYEGLYAIMCALFQTFEVQ